MTMTVRAIYEGGVLRPVKPLGLTEGETVVVTLARTEPMKSLPSEDEDVRRVQAARTIKEWLEATKLLPPDDGGYDIVKELHENRIWSGERPCVAPA